jgi:hypothetical protein
MARTALFVPGVQVLCPGGQARPAAGPILPGETCQRAKTNQADDHTLMEASASQSA